MLLLRSLAFMVLCCPLRASTESAVELGAEVSIEGSVGLAGSAQGGESLQGIALAHADWSLTRGADGTTFAAHASVLGAAGCGPSERYVGDFLGVSSQEAPEGVRLYAWWAEWRHGVSSLRIGAQLADEEFATTDGGAAFAHGAFGWPAFISANTRNAGPAFPIAALGVRWRYDLAPSAAVQFGVYDGDTFDSSSGDPSVNRHGLRHRLGGEQGWFAIGEIAWRAAARGPAFKCGTWVHTAAFDDLRDDAAGQPHALTGSAPRRHGENFGAYAAAEFSLGAVAAGRPAATNFFARVGVSPSDRSAVACALDLGVSRRGWWPGRPNDVAHLGVVRAMFSGRLADHERHSGSAVVSDYEQVVEAGYAFALTDRWTLRSDVQHVRVAGGAAARRNALVLLVRSEFRF